jgi:mitochondrial chaperone BCS1
METVILDGDRADRLVADARAFLAEAPWYAERGIPHRRGYLLYGPPGCGKSSFISALAGELQLPLCVLALSGAGLDGYGLMRLVNTAPETAILVLEDIDAVSLARPDADVLSGPSSGHLPVADALHEGPGGCVPLFTVVRTFSSHAQAPESPCG